MMTCSVVTIRIVATKMKHTVHLHRLNQDENEIASQRDREGGYSGMLDDSSLSVATRSAYSAMEMSCFT